jgi:hypothetical protein
VRVADVARERDELARLLRAPPLAPDPDPVLDPELIDAVRALGYAKAPEAWFDFVAGRAHSGRITRSALEGARTRSIRSGIRPGSSPGGIQRSAACLCRSLPSLAPGAATGPDSPTRRQSGEPKPVPLTGIRISARVGQWQRSPSGSVHCARSFAYRKGTLDVQAPAPMSRGHALQRFSRHSTPVTTRVHSSSFPL